MTKKAKSPTPNEAELFKKINPLKTNQLIAEMEAPINRREWDFCNRCGDVYKLSELFDTEEGWLCEECLREQNEQEDLEIIEREEARSHYSDEPFLGRRRK